MTANKGFSGAEYAEAFARLGSKAAVAKEFGVNESVVRRALTRYAARQNLDPAVQAAMAAANTGLVPSLAWVKTKASGDTPGFSVMLRPAIEPPEEIAQRIRDTLEGMQPADFVPPPQYVDADLCTIVPISDAHIGLQAWARETGEAYSTDIAAKRLRSWVSQVVSSCPASEICVILDNGDLTHADDHTNLTPASKHVLDVDTRHFRTLEVTVEALACAVDVALSRHNRVMVRVLPGNHNRESYIAVMFALAERYRENPRVEVQKVPGEFFALEWGKVMLAAHHGDKAKADRIVHFLADQYAEMWGRTKHRFLFTGHLHHHKSQDIGGVTWEQLRAVTARDAYAVSHAFTARAQLQAITFHKERGEIQRVKVNA